MSAKSSFEGPSSTDGPVFSTASLLSKFVEIEGLGVIAVIVVLAEIHGSEHTKVVCLDGIFG